MTGSVPFARTDGVTPSTTSRRWAPSADLSRLRRARRNRIVQR
jgi:hypothetical protein